MTDEMMEKRPEDEGTSFDGAIESFLEEERPHLVLDRPSRRRLRPRHQHLSITRDTWCGTPVLPMGNTEPGGPGGDVVGRPTASAPPFVVGIEHVHPCGGGIHSIQHGVREVQHQAHGRLR